MHGEEHNYSIHDKELMAIVRALQCWRAELVGLQTPFLVITDHEALKYFSTKRLLNLRQAGWAEFLAQYHFVISYRPGRDNGAADALSRKSLDWESQTNLNGARLTTRERLNRGDAQDMVKKIQGYVAKARELMTKAQDGMAKQANQHRRVPDFGVGDKAFIIKRSELSDRPSHRLDLPVTSRWFKIKEKCGHSYRLEVPEGWRGTDVFHADRLRKYPDNPLPGQHMEEPAGEYVGDDVEWEMEEILASKIYLGGCSTG